MKRQLTAFAISFILLSNAGISQADEVNFWDDIQQIDFSNDELPSNLYSEFTGKKENSFLQYCLPANYSKKKNYPLIVYVTGFHGYEGGKIQDAIDIANNRDCIVASLPLFKANVDRTEYHNGMLIGFADYPVLARAYKAMLEKFFMAVPNIDPQKSAMVGMSNGALAIAVLVSSNDKYILERFQSFCLVDQGMFHLTDLHKTPTRDRRFLILVGDKEAYGRDLMIRGAKLLQDLNQLYGRRVESRILKNIGHEITPSCKKDIGTWIFEVNGMPKVQTRPVSTSKRSRVSQPRVNQRTQQNRRRR
ncbi:MAG: alpha/beta hydrolase [Planctomycetota bacterium]|jgi:hypothetical protein